MRPAYRSRLVLMLFLGLVLGAIPVLHSLLKRIPSYCNYDRIIRERQIDPTALFYSEEQHTETAARWIEGRLDRPETD